MRTIYITRSGGQTFTYSGTARSVADWAAFHLACDAGTTVETNGTYGPSNCSHHRLTKTEALARLAGKGIR